MMQGRLYKSEKERMLMGVCGGIGHYLGVDPAFVRLFFFVFTMIRGMGVVLYLVLALLMPVAPPEEDHPREGVLNFNLDSAQAGNLVGVGLVVFGAVALLGSFDIQWLNWISIRNFFPFFLIGLGFWVLTGKSRTSE